MAARVCQALAILVPLVTVFVGTVSPPASGAPPGRTASAGAAVAPGWQGPIRTRARLVDGAIRVVAVAECADPDGGESSVTMTISQVDRRGRVVTGSGQAYADCYPTSQGGQDGRVTIVVQPATTGVFHRGSAFAVRDDQEGIRLGGDYGYFDAEVRWAELEVRRTWSARVSTPSTAVEADGRGERGRTSSEPDVVIDRVSARLVSGGAGAVVRIEGTCRQGADVGYAERVSVGVRQPVPGAPNTGGTKASAAFDSLACEEPDPGWIDVPVIPQGRPFRPNPARVLASYTATFGSVPESFDVSDSVRVRRVLVAR